MPELHVLRVFTAEDGTGGNPLGVFLGGAAVPAERRQAVAHRLGFSETVFVDDATTGAVRIFTPAVELPFAGHPLVGTAWLMRRQGLEVAVVRPPAGTVDVRFDGELTYIAGRPEWSPPFDFVEVESPAAVENVTQAPAENGMVSVWSWLDEAAGVVRARVFATAAGIAEDEATGSAAVRMGAMLGRPLTIRQGRGSVLHAAPRPDGCVEVAGRCVLDEVREDG
jgi:predicted PhzF superfamily epimerase YddE/YHI9